MQYIFVKYSIDCAHFLPKVPRGHKCGKMHGHRYDIRIEIAGRLNLKGWIMDYADLKAVTDPVVMALDHKVLNDIPGLSNPTCENIVTWIRSHIEIDGLSSIEVLETDRAGSGWRA